jgi:hypothetical protein
MRGEYIPARVRSKTKMADLHYRFKKRKDDQVTLERGAELAGVSYARFRKAVQRLKIPVERLGWMVIVPRSAVEQIKIALTDGTIRRGRPKKKGDTKAIAL